MTRGDVLHGRTYRKRCGCGWLYLTINEDKAGKPVEVFARLGKAGSCPNTLTEAMARVMAYAFRLGADWQEIAEHLAGLGCNNPIINGPTSCADAMAMVLKKHFDEKDNPKEKEDK